MVTVQATVLEIHNLQFFLCIDWNHLPVFFFNSFFYQEWLLHIIIRLAKNTHLPVQIAFLHFGPTTRENRAKTARTLIIRINNFKMKFMKCIFQLKFPSSSLVEVNMLTFKAQCINECIFFFNWGPWKSQKESFWCTIVHRGILRRGGGERGVLS